MKNIKIIFLVLFLTISVQKIEAQVYKFVATGFSVMEKDEKDNRGK